MSKNEKKIWRNFPSTLMYFSLNFPWLTTTTTTTAKRGRWRIVFFLSAARRYGKYRWKWKCGGTVRSCGIFRGSLALHLTHLNMIYDVSGAQTKQHFWILNLNYLTHFFFQSLRGRGWGWESVSESSGM